MVSSTNETIINRAGARKDRLNHVVVLTNNERKIVRPSSNLADPLDGSIVLHRNSVTGDWSLWNPGEDGNTGGWRDISQDTAREIVGGPRND